jgi:hypothetical protein
MRESPRGMILSFCPLVHPRGRPGPLWSHSYHTPQSYRPDTQVLEHLPFQGSKTVLPINPDTVFGSIFEKLCSRSLMSYVTGMLFAQELWEHVQTFESWRVVRKSFAVLDGTSVRGTTHLNIITNRSVRRYTNECQYPAIAGSGGIAVSSP